METAKFILNSKTFWFNILMLVLAIIELINPEILTVFGIEGASQTKALTIIAFFTSVINIALRYLTTGAITLKKAKNANNV